MVNNKKNRFIYLFIAFAFVSLSTQYVCAGIFGDTGSRKARAVPRFVSLRSDKVNARVGPSKKYPIKWVFVRRNYPLKVVREFDTWRLVEDRDGAKGWVHQSLLSGLRTIVVNNPRGDFVVLRSIKSSDKYKIVANVENGAILKILKHDKKYVYVVSLDGKHKGWIDSKECWGSKI